MAAHLSVMCLLVFTIGDYSTATTLKLEVDHGTYFPSLTKSMRLLCSVVDNTDTSIVGRRQATASNIVATPTDVTQVQSISISRTRVSGFVESVAYITTINAATPLVDARIMQASGNINPGPLSGYKGYLDVVWSHPLREQSGTYTCNVIGLTAYQNLEHVTSSIEINSRTPMIGDVASFLAANGRGIAALQSSVDDLKNRSVQLEEVTNRTLNYRNQLNTAEEIIQDLKKVYANVKNIQTGSIICNDDETSGYWVEFPIPYDSAPITFLSIRDLAVSGSSSSTAIGAIVEMVNSTGLLLRCDSVHLDVYTGIWIAYDA